MNDTEEVSTSVSTISISNSHRKDTENEKSTNNVTLKLKNSILEIMSVSSVHGMSNLVETDRKFIRFLWIFCMLFSSAGCGYFITKTVTDYLSYDVVSLIDIINEEYSEFPTVSMCMTAGGFDNDNDLKDSIIGCFFNSDEGCKLKPENYFEKYSDPLYGTCYRFNSGKDLLGTPISILNSTFGGLQFGLLLDLKVTISDEIDFAQLIIRVHNKSLSLMSLYNEEIFISSGTRSYLTVDRTFIERLEQPYNDCYKDPADFNLNNTIIDYIIASDRTYSQKECLRIFSNLNYLKYGNCGCNASLDTAEFDCLYKMASLNRTIFNCTWNYFQSFIQQSYETCSQFCPLECNTISYSVVLSSIYDYPPMGEIIASSLKYNFENYAEVKRNLFSIQIFYKDLNYKLISQQEKMLMSDLIPNIGGIMGLFLGTSFLSFIEILEIFFQIIFILTENRFSKRVRVQA